MRQSLSGSDVFQIIAIIILSMAAAVVYGILHDQVTARVCIEYFTVGHPDLGHPEIFHSSDPTVIGIAWGIVATWWVGFMLGVPLVIVARAGSRPKRSARSLVRPVAILMVVNGVCALFFGIIGWIIASHGWVSLARSLSFTVGPDKHAVFIADMWAHLSSYGVGFIGGLIVLVLVWRSRAKVDADSSGSVFQAPPSTIWYHLHVSSWIVLLGALWVAVLIVVPAEIIHSSPEYESINIDTFYRLEHGWPLTFLVRNRPPWFDGSRFAVVWGLGLDVQEFRPIALAIDCLIAAAGIATVVAFAEWRRRRQGKRRWYQFSLRAMLAAVTLLSIGIAWYCSELAADKRLRTHLASLGAVSSSGPWPPVNDESLVFGSSEPRSRLPGWLCILFDGNDSASLGVNQPGPSTLLWHRSKHEHIKYLVDHFPARVHVEFLSVQSEADWNLIKQLSRLESVGFFDGGSEALEHLQGFTRLKVLELKRTPKDRKLVDQDLACLENFPDLESFTVFNAELKGLGFSYLRACGHLKHLSISASSLSEAGIESISQLNSLESLTVDGPVSIELAHQLTARLEQRRDHPIRVYTDNPSP